MAKITHVKKAQPRYETKPVLDDNGEPKRTALTDKRTGLPKTTKHGRPVTIAVTVRDLDRPLPPEKCDYPGCTVHPEKLILPGMPYKHMSPRSGPYGGRKLTRHEECPSWNVWEYSSSTSASVARIQSEGADAIDGAELETEDDAEALRDEITELARELYDEKNDNLSNLPEQFQESGDLYEQVDALESWVGGIEDADLPDFPDNGTEDCDACDGTGDVECTGCGGDGSLEDGEDCPDCLGSGTEDCGDCSGTGEVESDEPDDEDLEAWRDEVRTAIQDALDDCGV